MKLSILLPLIILWLLASVSAFAQSSPTLIDSLKKQNKAYVKKDSIRVNLLVSLADALVTTDPNEAMRYTDEAIRLAEEIKSPMGIAAAYREKANMYYLLNDYSQAVDFNYKALKAADNLKKNKGSILFVAIIYNNLGGIYLEMKEYDKALANFTNYLTVVRKLNEPSLRREEAMALLNLGETYSRKKDNQKAIQYANQSLAIAEPDKDYQMAAYNLSTLGVVYTNLKQSSLAVESCKKCILYADKAGDLKVKSSCVGQVADALFDLKQYDESEKYAKQALQIAKELKSLELQRQITQLLAYIYIAQKKSQPAVTNLEASLALRDSILSDDKKSDIARKEERFEREKNEVILKTEIKQRQTERNALAAIALVVILASGISLFFNKRRRDAEKRQRDADQQAERATFNELVADTELKALRAQMEPHFIYNALNSIRSFVLRNEPNTADKYLTDFGQLMRITLEKSIEKTVRLSDELKALQLYLELESLHRQFSYEIHLDENIDPDDTRIMPLLLQPLVENSIKWGVAQREDGHISVRIREEKEMLICIVEDNGIGRAKAALLRRDQPARTSLGTKITNNRISIFNELTQSKASIATVDLAEGTRVEVRLPMEFSY